MARFFVGQRVKVVRNVGPLTCAQIVNKLIGVEANISGFDDSKTAWPDGHNIILRGYELFRFHRDDLEPILPSGHQPAELTVEELLPFLKTREVA